MFDMRTGEEIKNRQNNVSVQNGQHEIQEMQNHNVKHTLHE